MYVHLEPHSHMCIIIYYIPIEIKLRLKTHAGDEGRDVGLRPAPRALGRRGPVKKRSGGSGFRVPRGYSWVVFRKENAMKMGDNLGYSPIFDKKHNVDVT